MYERVSVLTQICMFFFFQAEDGIRDPLWSRGLGDVYKRQAQRKLVATFREVDDQTKSQVALQAALFDFLYREARTRKIKGKICLLYTSDAADDTPCVDLGGRRIIKKQNCVHQVC
ncbi:hypothetical protein AMBR_EADFOONE_02823 [Lacticaseibacillus rhamnosus]|nr:hypothetical protein AMBR_EADFOONE_02823 [Lacticaseibacillus rhamnosus]